MLTFLSIHPSIVIVFPYSHATDEHIHRDRPKIKSSRVLAQMVVKSTLQMQARIQSPKIGGAQVISMKLPLILTQNQPTE